MKILITGAFGSIGKRLLSKLKDTEDEIWLLGRNISSQNLYENKKIFPVELDITNCQDIKRLALKLPKTFDICIHLAAQTEIAVSLKDPQLDINTNAIAIVYLLETFSFRKFIYVSTGSVYEGQMGKVNQNSLIAPSIPYAISKFTGELYVKSFQKYRNNPGAYLILRIFNIYGPYMNPNKFLQNTIKNFAIDKRRDITLKGSGKAIVDPLYVDDMISALLKAVQTDIENEVIDICYGNPMTIAEFTLTIASFFDIDAEINLSGVSHEEITFYGDSEPSKRLLDFYPQYSLKDGVMEYYNFLMEQRIK